MMGTMISFEHLVISLLLLLESTVGGPCSTGTTVGPNIDAASNDIDTDTGLGLLIDDSDYTFQCCGNIHTWEFYPKNTGTVQLQVWRNTAGTTWELRGQNSYIVATGETDQKKTLSISTNEQILVDANDVIGMYFPGTPIISHKQLGGGNVNSVYLQDNTIGSLTTGATYDWTTQQTGRDYAIQATLSSNAPSFTGHLTAVEFFDDTASGSLVKTITATDADALDTLTFSMTSTTSSFTFNAATRELRSVGNLPTSPSVATSTTTLTFSVTDVCSNSDTGELEIKVKNNPPSITNLPSTTEISEDVTTATLLYTLAVTDNSPADVISCSVTNVSPTSTDFSMTALGLYINANPTLNYDTNKRYTLTITCTDTKESTTGEFIVFLTRNQPPSITNLASGASVALSTSTASGDTIYTVTATDPEGDSLFYSMTCDQSSCPFQISSLTGIVKATSNLGSLTVPAYDLYIYVYDNKTLVGPRTLTLIVTDINVAPSFNNLPLNSPISIVENLALGTSVFTVSASDPNSQDTVSYSPVFTPTTAAGYFSFDRTTGLLSTASTFLNYEALNSAGSTTITIAVTASDGSASVTQNLVLEVIDVNEAPQFDRQTYTLNTNEGQAGSSVGTPGFVVTDPDTGASFSYSIDCATFIMNSATGSVTFSAEYDTDAAGVGSTVSCTVTVSDGSLTDTCQLVVTINDVNDNTPSFSQPTYVFFAEAIAVGGTTIGTISAPDGDNGAYGVVTYSLDQSGLSKSYFGVQSNGVVYVNEDLSSFTAGQTITVTATATDAGGLSDTSTVIIVIPEYTTIVYATSSERMISFIEDRRNVAWVVMVVLTMVAIIGLVGFVTYRFCRCGEGFKWCSERCCDNFSRRRKLRSDELSSY